MTKILALFLIFSSLACSHLKSRKQGTQETQEPQAQEVVLVDEGKSQELAPVEEAKEPPKLGLILGPGSVKAFAHTGVIKELVKAGIPISYVVGIEWGALVGGMYAGTKKINDTEWKLYKLQAKKLKDPGWFSSDKKVLTISSYEDFFKQNLSDLNLKDLKIPFACPSVSIWSGAIIWQEAGSLKKAIERCMPSPPLFKPKGPWMAALFSSEEAVDFLRKKGMDVILYVDVLGKSQPLGTKELMSEYTSALLWQELKKDVARVKMAEGLVKVEANTLKFQLYDFSARSSLAAAGLKAGLLAADTLVEKFDF